MVRVVVGHDASNQASVKGRPGGVPAASRARARA
jgi:hypothetical protein